MKKICLIDADSMLFITIYSVQSNADLNSDDFGVYKKQIDEWITDTITKTDSTCYNLFLTVGRVFRHDVATNREYKSGRPKDKPKFYYELRKHVIDKWGATYQDGVEAEDLVAIVNEKYHEPTALFTPIIARIDHDFDQIRGGHFNYKKGEFTIIDEDQAHYNLWKMLLVGCSTDKIEGIPGIGDKKADKILADSISGDYKNKVLNCYINHYGLCRGVKLFAETFKLIYLLRTPEEIESIIGMEYIIPQPIEYIKVPVPNSKHDFE
jgi:hypothetical protein